jgi:hypothetical protein
MIETAEIPVAMSRLAQLRARMAMIIVGLLSLLVVVTMPVVILSIASAMRSVVETPLYSLMTGERVTDAPAATGEDVTFANVSITDIDETTRAATMIVAGNRECSAVCPPLTLTLYSLAGEGTLRRGLPPSAAIEVPEGSGTLTTTITLPVSGNPQRYPFDSYTLTLGFSAVARLPDGRTIAPPRSQVVDATDLTVDSSIVRLNMQPPQPVDPASVDPEVMPDHYLAVQRLVFSRPLYLQILSTLLVLLISASGFFALITQTLRQLSIGIGGLILGIWGIRSIVIQGNLPDVTAVDSALAIVILLLLLGVAIRVALAVRTQAGWD